MDALCLLFLAGSEGMEMLVGCQIMTCSVHFGHHFEELESRHTLSSWCTFLTASALEMGTVWAWAYMRTKSITKSSGASSATGLLWVPEWC